MNITLNINEKDLSLEIDPNESLLNVLRRNNLFSVKEGCGEGHCGCCTVLLDNKPVPSCIISAFYANKTKIVTLENFTKTDDYIDIKKGFELSGVTLCGYCNSGKIFAAYDIISKNLRPDKDYVAEYISNLECNCTETDTLVQGIIKAASIRRQRMGAY